MLRVVLVEDEEPILRELAEAFSWRSVNCTVAATAQTITAARECIARENPDIVITDIQLPDGDGLTLIRDTAPPAAIVITGYPEVEYAQGALRLRVVDFLLKPFSDAELRNAVVRAVTLVLGNSKAVKQGDSVDTVRRNPLVHEAQVYIQKHYDTDISLQTAARDLGITRGHLARIFKDETGHTFLEALTEYRMNRAQTMLRDARAKINEVAEALGYHDPAYFSRVFRRHLGVSPREFRRRY